MSAPYDRTEANEIALTSALVRIRVLERKVEELQRSILELQNPLRTYVPAPPLQG